MQSDRHGKVLYDGLSTFGLRLANAALAFGLSVVTARMLGAAGRGIYVLPGVEAALVTSAFGGLSSATSYFLLNRRPGRSFLWVLTLSACIAVLLAAAAIVPLALLMGSAWSMMPAMLVLPAMAALNIATGYAIGTKQVRYSAAITTFQTAITLAGVGTALFLTGRAPFAAIGAWVATTLIAATAVTAFMLAHALRNLQGRDDITLGEYLRFCAKVSLTYIVTLLNYRADLYIVAVALPPAALGMYGIAISGAETLLLPTQVASLVASPHIASSDLRTSRDLAARCVRNNLIVALALCLMLFLLAPLVVQVVFGTQFLPLVPAFDVLLIGVVAVSLGSPVSAYFTLKLGQPQVPLVLAGFSAAVCIAVTAVLVSTHGMLGAAIGSSAGYLAGQMAGLWYFTRRTALRPQELFLPTAADLRLYSSFLARLLADGRRLLHGA